MTSPRKPKAKRAGATVPGPLPSEPTEREIIAAFAYDCSEQYTDKSSAKLALQDLSVEIQQGEHMDRFDRGEFDDLIGWIQKRLKWAKRAHR